MRAPDPDYQVLDLRPAPAVRSDVPVELTARVVRAIQQLEKGTANAEQQKLALGFIINHLSRPYEPNWYHDSPRLTDHAAGRAFIGHQLVGILKINLAHFTQKENLKHAR